MWKESEVVLTWAEGLSEESPSQQPLLQVNLYEMTSPPGSRVNEKTLKSVCIILKAAICF